MTKRLTHEQRMDRHIARIADSLRGCLLTPEQVRRLTYAAYACALPAIAASADVYTDDWFRRPLNDGLTIDRDAVLAAIDHVCRDDLSDYYGDVRQRMHDAVLALPRPVDGVTLTRDEAAIAAAGLNWAALHPTDGAPSTWGSRWIELRDRLQGTQ